MFLTKWKGSSKTWNWKAVHTFNAILTLLIFLTFSTVFVPKMWKADWKNVSMTADKITIRLITVRIFNLKLKNHTKNLPTTSTNSKSFSTQMQFYCPGWLHQDNTKNKHFTCIYLAKQNVWCATYRIECITLVYGVLVISLQFIKCYNLEEKKKKEFWFPRSNSVFYPLKVAFWHRAATFVLSNISPKFCLQLTGKIDVEQVLQIQKQ